MNLYLRLLKSILVALFKTRIKLFDSTEVTYRVWPNDMDFAGNMNNGRFLTLSDLARFDMMISLGMLKPILKKKWFPVIAGYSVSYLRPLKRLRTFSIRSELLGWDNRFFYLKHEFIQNNRIAASILAQTCLRSSDGVVNSLDVLKEIPSYNQSVQPPPHLKEVSDFFIQSSKIMKKFRGISGLSKES